MTYKESDMIKYTSHSDEADGSKRVGFRTPDYKNKYQVTMPAGYRSNSVLDWIRNEGVEDILTKKYYLDIQNDKDHNIKRELVILINGFRFFFNSFDGDIEIYRVIYGTDGYCFGLIKNIEELFDFYSEKTINLIKGKIESEFDIKFKSIKLVNEVFDKVIRIDNIDQYKRDKKLHQILGYEIS